MSGMGEKRENVAEKTKLLVEQRRISIKQWNVDYFFKIIDNELEDFWENDKCHKLADNYLVAMVFMYFLRASFKREEYTRFNFFAALYLAHDMEEDDEDMRADLVVWAPAVDEMWTPSSLINQREQLFQRMRYRAVVSRACCEVIMSNTNPSHPVWKKHRHPAHAGAYPRHYFSTRDRINCPNCILEESPEFL